MGIRYTHQAITTEQQIDILKERGLLIDDVEHAIEVLRSEEHTSELQSQR